MYRIGLTGGIGSGKTEVAAVFRDLGARVLEADTMARELVAPGTPALERIEEEFGSAVLDADGALDRGELAAIVFGDPERLARLNAIVHPPLTEAVLSQIEALERDDADGVVVVDAALLLDWDISDAFDLIVVVRAPLEERLSRLVAGGLSRDDAEARAAAQRPEDDLAEAADVVVDNDGTLADLRERITELWANLPGRLGGRRR